MSDLAIRNWSQYQHYGDRSSVPWIKYYIKLLNDKGFFALTEPTRLVWCLLLLVAARRANEIPDDPVWLSREVKMSVPKCRTALKELKAGGFLVLASEQADSEQLASTKDASDQSASKIDSELPASDQSASPHARTRSKEEKRREEKVEAKASTPKPPTKERKPDPLWDTLAREIGPAETKSERGRRNKALAELRDVGATPGEVVVRAGRYRRRFGPDIELTATALAANWSLLATSANGSAASMYRETEDERETRLLRDMATRGPQTNHQEERT